MNHLLTLLFLLTFFLTGNAQVPQLEIWEIQGSSYSSLYEGEEVYSPANVVTAVGSDRFFIQTPTGRSDNDPTTSDGIMVYTGGEPAVSVGQLVDVTGWIQEYEGLTEFSASGLEIEIVIDNQSLPEPALLDAAFPSGTPQPLHQLERVEGMRVSIENGMSTSPMDQYGCAYVNAGGTRTFREPGIPFPGINGLPVWDENPEVFTIDVNRLLDENPAWYSGTVFSATGVMSYADYDYVFYPTEYTYQPNPLEQAVRAKTDSEVSVGSINTLVLSVGGSSYEARITKLANYIVEAMQSPDVVALQEVGSIAVLDDVVDRIESLYPAHFTYVPHLQGSSSGGFSIQLGYLVSEQLTDVEVQELGVDEYMSTGGILHDRPPLYLEANLPANPPIPIRVLNIHLRSLNGIEGSNASYVRQKRHEQAVSVAYMIEERAEDNLIVVGDFNAYQFSDGYVDVFNQISGLPSEGALLEVVDITDPPLVHYNSWLPDSQQYSYVYRGNAQMIDHCLSTHLSEDLTATDFAFVRGNTDLPEGAGSSNSPFGISDHDGFVLFLEVINGSTSAPPSPPSVSPSGFQGPLAYPNPFNVGDLLYVELERKDHLDLYLYGSDGRLLHRQVLGSHGSGAHTIYPDFPALSGFCVIRLLGAHHDITGKVVMMEEE